MDYRETKPGVIAAFRAGAAAWARIVEPYRLFGDHAEKAAPRDIPEVELRARDG